MLNWINTLQDLSFSDQINTWLRNIALQYGYLGVFIACFIGTLSVVIPIPYTVIIFMLGRWLDPALLAVSAGFGAALGEFLGYMMGYLGRVVMSDERKKKMEYMLKVFDRYGPLAIFFFALTPLPDDLLFIPLGIMRYNFIKAFIPCVSGKMLMSFILALGGRFSISFIEMIFGGGENTLLTMLVTSALLALIIIVMLKVDWENLLPSDKK
ncbi:MAG: VTT domain-containing protein [Candidatus Bathyarchaeota archaeon]|nr:VTT domain-containing protein [Candidatus Bathyarchaeota archaeon]